MEEKGGRKVVEIGERKIEEERKIKGERKRSGEERRIGRVEGREKGKNDRRKGREKEIRQMRR